MNTQSDLIREATAAFRGILGGLPGTGINDRSFRSGVEQGCDLLVEVLSGTTLSFAVDERTKPKDAYDVAFVLNHYQPGLLDLAEKVRVLLGRDLAARGYDILKGKFATLEMVGPVWAAQVAREQGADYEQSRRAAFENARELFRLVGR